MHNESFINNIVNRVVYKMALGRIIHAKDSKEASPSAHHRQLNGGHNLLGWVFFAFKVFSCQRL